MNAEELKYLRALQPEIAKRMGFQRSDDTIWCPKCQDSGILVIHSDECDEEIDNLIRIPLAIDSEDPERGLWGMVDWNRFAAEITRSGKLWTKPIGPGTLDMVSFLCDPYLALLKALAVQWNVEVEP